MRIDGLAGADSAGTSRDGATHWREVARQWHLVGPPLRPAPEDVAFLQQVVQEWTDVHDAPPRVLLLGVTPEIYGLSWPDGTEFLAADHTRAMIDAVWPGPREAALHTGWLELSLGPRSRDLIFCDGGLHLLTYPDEQHRLTRALRAMLAEGGMCVFRLFVPPARRESPRDVLRDLAAGRIPNVNCLKMRLWMALQERVEQGVELDAVWRVVNEAAADLAAMAAKIGWPVEETLVLNTYRGTRSRYHLATFDQVTDMFCCNPGGFELARLFVPGYELGGMCPTVVLRRSPGAQH